MSNRIHKILRKYFSNIKTYADFKEVSSRLLFFLIPLFL